MPALFIMTMLSYSWYGGVAVEIDEGVKSFSKHLEKIRQRFYQNHGLLTVGDSVDASDMVVCAPVERLLSGSVDRHWRVEKTSYLLNKNPLNKPIRLLVLVMQDGFHSNRSMPESSK
jgi:hypothetical protein